MVNLDIFHRILTFSSNTFDDSTYTVDDILDEEDIIKAHNVPVMASDSYVYHVNDRSNSNIFNNMFLKMLTWLPVQDMDIQWKNIDTALKGIDNHYGDILNKPRVQKYIQKSLSLSQMDQISFLKFLVNEGMAAHLCKYEDDIEEYIIDLMYMKEYSVREGLLPYGASLIMSKDMNVKYIVLPFCIKDGKIAKITTSYNIDSENWQMAYNVFTSSLIAHVTIKNHAIECHFILAGGMLSTYTDNYQHMDYNLINFIKPFIFRTGDVNSSALSILVNKGGIVNRLFSFTQESLSAYMHDCFSTYKFTYPLENMCTCSNLYKDCKQILSVIENFVNLMVNKILEERDISISSFLEDINRRIPGILVTELNDRENLVRVLCSHIFNVSVWHEHIGNMSQYIMHPKLFRVKPYLTHYNATLESEQNTYQNVFLALTTSATALPKLNCNLSRLHNREYIEIYKEFQQNLNELISKCDHMDVLELECSVSL